jgi:uncharacterized membrane protein YraQ (UPF0718 family)
MLRGRGKIVSAFFLDFNFYISGNNKIRREEDIMPPTTLTMIKGPGKLASVFNDRIISLMLLLLIALSLIDHHQALQSIIFVGKALFHISPFFALAILFAAFAKASGADQLIARAFSGNTIAAIVAGSLTGAISPFCSCGVIPVIAGMLASGVPLAPVMAFCIASPIMDPEMFILTAAGINLNFAIAKTITAIGMGLLSGFTILSLQKLGYVRQPLKKVTGSGYSQPSFNPQLPIKISWRFWQESKRKKEFRSQIKTNGLFLGKWMTLAFFFESMMVAYISAGWVAGLIGTGSTLAIPASAIIGIPAYMNGYAAIPLISGLMELGMTPGAALSFATAGAVSSIPAALAVYALVKRSVFLVYIALGLTGSLIAGYFYQLIDLV